MANSLKTLKKSSEYQKIRRLGHKCSVCKWLTASYIKNDEKFFRYGYTLTRKVGNAVIRNRMKRWSREFFLKNHEQLSTVEIDVNLVFRPISEQFYKELSHVEFDKAMAKTIAKILAHSQAKS